MATTNTATFTMDFTEIAEEAFERAGRELHSGYDLKTARRSMNLLTIEWANRGINMWTIDEGFINLVQGTATYDLPAATIDLIEQVIRTNAGSATLQSDLNLSRISVSTYSSVPNKLTQGRPVDPREVEKLDKKNLVMFIYAGAPSDAYKSAGTEAKIQLNDKFADVKDIASFITLNLLFP